MLFDLLSQSKELKKEDHRAFTPSPGLHIVSPGELITSDSGFMRGHGSFSREEKLFSSLSGRVDRVNKLICVEPLKSRYTGEVGDVVVGRVVEVVSKRWKVEANARQHAALLLSAINLPGGVQRRKLESDELQMRNYLIEGDVICAEVQNLHQDGSISLHTRSTKYGKLRNGVLIIVPPALIKRSKTHFLAFSFGVTVILGLNGFIWVGKSLPDSMDNEEAESSMYSSVNDVISDAERELIVRVCTAVELLSSFFMYVNETNIMTVFELSKEYGIDELYSYGTRTKIFNKL